MLDKNKRQNKIIKKMRKDDVVDEYESKKLGMRVVRDDGEEVSSVENSDDD